jgi:lipoprotein-releasing system permease protein
MRFEWFVASRFIWSKRRHPFVGVISWISAIGIAVGVAALIVVLAVMTGFDQDLKDRIIGMRAHIVIGKEALFTDADDLAAKLRMIPSIRGASSFVEGQALFQAGQMGSGVLVRGIDAAEERKVSKFYDYLTQGTLSGTPKKAVVGTELAQHMNLRIGSTFDLLSERANQPTTFVVEGIFSSGMYEFDANLIFINLEDAKQLFLMGKAASGVAIALDDPEKALVIKNGLQKNLQYPYEVRTWMEMNRTLFGALRLEKFAMFLILALIILVACLNIAGCLTILVMDKTRDIGILRAMGVTQSALVRIFALDGLILGAGGATLGFAAGMGVCLLLKKYSFVELPKDIYYLDHLPVRITGPDLLAVLTVAIVLSFLSAVYPAIVAGRLDTVKALRYE